MERASVEFALATADGAPLGVLRVATLPRRTPPRIAELLDLTETERELEPIQLLENSEYVFEILGPARAEADPPELFVADDARGTRGRLRTGLHTGRVDVRIVADGVAARPIAFEVRSSKLGYRDDYRRMLGDIAQRTATALLLQQFAPSAQRIAPRLARDPDTLYQHFVFLNGLLATDALESALRRVIAEPHVEWRAEHEARPPGRGLRASATVARQLVRPGPRVEWRGPLPHIPARVDAARAIETVDNVPNRFVLFALREWRGLVAALAEHLAEKPRTIAAERGLRETAVLADRLDALLRAPLFRDLGRLGAFPTANQVLQKRAGYREILNAYLLVHAAAELAWGGGDLVFGAGQRDVATLYEYWVYLELVAIIEQIAGGSLDNAGLVYRDASGTRLRLRRGDAHAVRGRLVRRNRPLAVELYFNRTFDHQKDPQLDGSWSREMRPDCSLHIIPLDAPDGRGDLWINFDAKYRLDDAGDLYRPEHQDLDRMHAYHDAIGKARGAFIVYPGTEKTRAQPYDEVLPSVGAFPLRPTPNGAAGARELATFLATVFDHVANQGARDARMEYWTSEAIRGPRAEIREAWAHLTTPPADTTVLLGFVKSRAQHAWVAARRLYNVRADPKRHGAVGLRGPELSAEFLALYGELGAQPALWRISGEPQLLRAEDLVEMGYPEPRGSVYFCLGVEPVEPPAWLTPAWVRAVAERVRGAPPDGRPVVATWLELVGDR